MSFIEINDSFGFSFESLTIFILMIFIVWIIFLIYSLKIYGIKKTFRYFFPIIVIGIIAEILAMANSGYYYPGYFIYISALSVSVPVIIAIGWSVNLFLFLHIGKDVATRIYKKRNFKQLFFISVFAGLFGVSFDLLEDPLAHYSNWWVWNQSIQRMYIFEVPLVNYLGWFGIIGGMTLLTLLIDRSSYSENRKLLINITTPFICFIFVGTYFLLI